jgi:hypothetical protein
LDGFDEGLVLRLYADHHEFALRAGGQVLAPALPPAKGWVIRLAAAC